MFYGEDRSFHEPPLRYLLDRVCARAHARAHLSKFTAYPIGVPVMRVFLYRCANDTIDFEVSSYRAILSIRILFARRQSRPRHAKALLRRKERLNGSLQRGVTRTK